jgi:hypothetical protein
MKKIIFYILFSFASTQLFAQEIEFTVGVDSNEVLIGDYINVTTILKYPTEKYSLIFPNINEAYTTPFKIITQSKIDTIESSRYTTLQQTTTIASYDSGLYKLDKLHVNGFQTDADSAIDIASDSILIRVSEVAVNIDGDIKDIISAEKKSTLWRNIIITFCILLFLSIAIYFIYKYKNHKKIPIAEKQMDAYEYANTQLQQIKNATPLTLLDSKNYYSTITDSLKYYIQHRYNITVLDKTSDETIDAFRNDKKMQQFVADTQQIFGVADMVKFAKVEATAMQNKNTWEQAYKMIQTLEQNYQIEMQRIAEAQKKNG